ncbi:MAG: MBOAT family O-acyltransferase [Eubacteriales bacterium]
MLFSSIPFLFYFLPIVLALYFITPAKLKNAVLLLASLFFYFWGEPKYTLLMLLSITLSFCAGLLIERFRGTVYAKIFLVCGTASSLLLLGFFKYADFFIANINALLGLSVPLLKLALPIGISFYTFQSLSYVVDVYRGDAKAQRNFIDLAAYVALFPQLIAGPIVRYTDIEGELSHRLHTTEDFAAGAFRFTVGLAKKVLFSNQLGELCDIFRASDEKSVLFYWLYAVAFSLHIYFDFSGYSDMAIGLGRIFGFRFPENFNYPYISRSITEFWRRWHMSLGSWFRDYVYIPMGGNRVSRPRWLFNIFVVWMLTGFWHGADWNFILWGLYFAVFLILEKLWIGKLLQKLPAALSHLYLLFLVVISFVIFNADGMAGVTNDLRGLFGAAGLPAVTEATLYYLRSYAVVLLAAIAGATPAIRNAAVSLSENRRARGVIAVAEGPAMLVMLVLAAAYLVDGSFNPFLYFRF